MLANLNASYLTIGNATIARRIVLLLQDNFLQIFLFLLLTIHTLTTTHRFKLHCVTSHIWMALCNSLPSKLRQCYSLGEFRQSVKKHLFPAHDTLWHFS